MVKTLALDDVDEDLGVDTISVGRVNLGEREYITSEEVYSSLRDSDAQGSFSRCVFSQCVYSRK